MIARATATDGRPRSAVGHGVGLAGLAGLVLWFAIALRFRMDGPFAALVAVLAAAMPMILWSVAVDRVHRRATTGIAWTQTRPLRETIDISLTKLAGLWATWAALALLYGIGRFYWEQPYRFAMSCLAFAAPVLFVASIPYVLWLDRRLVAPRDGAWALGAWLMGQPTDRTAIFAHLRVWAVKGFFLAFMLAIVPGGFDDAVHRARDLSWHDPVALASWLITVMFVVDVAFATAGYILTVRPLDAHIRSAEPYASGWVAALICYPPFILMGDGGPLDYAPGTRDWSHWYAAHPWLLCANGAALVVLTAIYAWSTVAFGLRFSNLTHRGILTHGPYAWSRHPAYLSKNLFWWLSTVPVLTTGNWTDAARATALLAIVSGVYYWRARTEERHLGLDPDYIAYSRWIEAHGPIPRLSTWLGGRSRRIRPTRPITSWTIDDA